jgi:iron complex transport system ATP-binding protein
VSRTALAVEGLRIVYEGREVLHGVDLEVPAGQLLAVVGPNGAGKSTLLRALTGLVPAAAGRVVVDGRPLGRWSRRELARRVGYVPQADGRSLPFSVRSFVEMGRYPHLGRWGSLKAADLEAVQWALVVTGTAHLSERALDTLSGGDRQLVSISAALAQGASTLLLDEPTSFLDYRHQVEVIALLERLHVEPGLTIVAVSHDLNASLAAADAVLALRDGRVAFHGPPRAILEPATLRAIYDVELRLASWPGSELPLVLPRGGGR